MNHIVPDFDSNEDYRFPEFHTKSSMGGGNEDTMELLWQNGQVVMHSQNQNSSRNKRPLSQTQLESAVERTVVREVRSIGPSDLFMQEDEMASWLHYPMDENSIESYLFNNDLLYPIPPSSAPITTASVTLPLPLPPPTPPPPSPSVLIPSLRPSIPPFRRVEMESGPPKYTNFMHFSRPVKSFSPELGQSCSSKIAPAKILPSPLTVVASNETQSPKYKASRLPDKPSLMNIGGGGSMSGVGVARTSSAGRERETCEISVTSSPGSNGGSRGTPPPPSGDRKRKGRDTDDTECHSEDAEFEYHDAKKQLHSGSTSTKRSRAAEVHNLSERKRRDKINEKMKALQELIPRCNKSDKASMLDEAIEYLKSLQMQVRMMSMGCSMVPMMFPGVPQYLPSVGMGMGMGMRMRMDMGMNRTMVPYPAILPGPSLSNHPAAGQAANMSAPMMGSLPQHNQNQERVSNFVDPFQQYIGLHQAQLPLPQNQGGIPLIATKLSGSKTAINHDHHQTS